MRWLNDSCDRRFLCKFHVLNSIVDAWILILSCIRAVLQLQGQTFPSAFKDEPEMLLWRRKNVLCPSVPGVLPLAHDYDLVPCMLLYPRNSVSYSLTVFVFWNLVCRKGGEACHTKPARKRSHCKTNKQTSKHPPPQLSLRCCFCTCSVDCSVEVKGETQWMVDANFGHTVHKWEVVG